MVRTGIKKIQLETKVTLKVVRTGIKRVLIYSKIDNATGNKGNFESGQNRNQACSYIHEDRKCNPLLVTMDTMFVCWLVA